MLRLGCRANAWDALLFATVAATIACGSSAEGAPTSTSESESPAVTVEASAGATADRPLRGTNAAVAGVPGASAGASGARASSASAAAPMQMRSAAAGAAGSAAADSGEDAGVSSAAELGGDGTIPCGPWKALAHACHSCHGEVPTNGAPMSLVTQADFQILSVQKAKIPKYDLARMRIDGSRRPIMPPGGAITDEDKQSLIDWLSRKAPLAGPDEPSCN